MNRQATALTLSISIALIICGCSGRKAPAPVIEVYQGKTFHEFEKNSYQDEKYQVKKGDTLFSIAWQSGNDYKDLAQINGISEPYNIFPGQILSLKKQPVKKIKKTGPTTKLNVNQPVDPKKKQAYGENTAEVKTKRQQLTTQSFAKNVDYWTWPSQGKIIKRFSPNSSGINGIDFSGKFGEPILASAAGKVVYTGDALRGYGNLIIIKHSDDFLSAYAHNERILVDEQQWIKAGDKIATMGRSGTDKVMLHFEVRYKGKSVDPLRYLPKQQ